MMDGLVRGVKCNSRVEFAHVPCGLAPPYSGYLIKLGSFLLSSSQICLPVQPLSQGVPSCTLLLHSADTLESRDNE
jgi:hypothetical protein